MFTVVADPVGAGYVLLLKEVAPAVTRVAVLRESGSVSGPAQFGAIQTVASRLGVELRAIDTRDVNQIEGRITAFARDPNGGIIVTGSPAATVHRKAIVARKTHLAEMILREIVQDVAVDRVFAEFRLVLREQMQPTETPPLFKADNATL